MNLNLGKFSLSLAWKDASKNALAQPSRDSPLLVTLDQPRNPFVMQRYDNPRHNILYIRETVAACMHARAEAVGRGVFRAFASDWSRSADGSFQSGHKKGALPMTHPLAKLLQHPNPLFDMGDLLELSMQWLDATGNSLWLKVRNDRGEVVELWPCAALNFYIERGEDQLPANYFFTQTNIRIPAADIIHIRRNDIRTAPFMGHAVLSDIIDTAKAETAVRMFQSRFFENDATPRAVLRFPQGAMLSQTQIDELRRTWDATYSGPENSGRIGILSDGGEVQLLGPGSKELDFARSKKDLRDSIREAFKVPGIVLGDTENVNLANAETSYSVFVRDVVDYALMKHARALTRSLAHEFSTNGHTITIEHEDIIPEAESQFLSRLQELKQSATIDEQRAMLGLPPLPGGKGSVFVVGNTVLDSEWKRC